MRYDFHNKAVRITPQAVWQIKIGYYKGEDSLVKHACPEGKRNVYLKIILN